MVADAFNFLQQQNLRLDYILNTHHHFDHIGGNIELKKKYNAKVVGFNGDKHRIPDIDITLNDKDEWVFGNSQVKILHIPGHTLGHICFFFKKEKIAFTGDTLFSLGCGKIFEGTYLQMHKSLNFFKSLPLDTKVFSILSTLFFILSLAIFRMGCVDLKFSSNETGKNSGW